MNNKNQNAFTFCVLAYNHSNYIIEHLESIKYQITNFLENWNCCLAISDDASTDNTTQLIDDWLEINAHYFADVRKYYNQTNKGTCYVVRNIIENHVGYIKITAGDDIYNNISIVTDLKSAGENTILVGKPLQLIDGNVSRPFFNEVLTVFSQYASKKYSVIEQLKRYIIINAPNSFYPIQGINDRSLGDFLLQFDVVEDLALQIYLAENHPNLEIKFVDTCFVLYRRTKNSTYLVANERFKKDQFALLMYLANGEKNFIRRLALIMRATKFNKNSKYKLYLIPKSIFLFFRFHLFIFAWFKVRKTKLDVVAAQLHADGIRSNRNLFDKKNDIKKS